jgi:hypothetical protein
MKLFQFDLNGTVLNLNGVNPKEIHAYIKLIYQTH